MLIERENRTQNSIKAVSSLLRDIKRGGTSLNHPLQRCAEQWEVLRKGNFIRRILWRDAIQPIHICTQDSGLGYKIAYVIDGKQRVSTLGSYINDEFAISKKIDDPIVEYEGVLYETRNRNGKITLVVRKNRKTGEEEFVPVLDEEGNTQFGMRTFDIRGAKFSQLPPELQETIQDYNIPIITKENCTDDEIKQEIIDFNSGKAMRVEQIGVCLLGVDRAKKIAELENSDFIKDCCKWGKADEKNGTIKRRIVESLCLIGGEYVKDYKTMCKTVFSGVLDGKISDLEKLLDDMSGLASDNGAIREYLGSNKGKEIPVLLACFDDFEKNQPYEIEAFGHFLGAWIDAISTERTIEGEDEDGNIILESYGEHFKSNPNDPGVIQDRISEVKRRLNEFLEKNCADLNIDNDFDNKTDDVSYAEIDTSGDEEGLPIGEATIVQCPRFIEEFSKCGLSDYVEADKKGELAIRCAMALDETKPTDFSRGGISEYLTDLKDGNEFCEDVMFFADELCSYLGEVFDDKTNALCTIDDIPLLMWGFVRKFRDEEVDDHFVNWLGKFSDECQDNTVALHHNYFEHSGTDRAAIMTRKSIMEQSVTGYFSDANN